MAATKAVVVLLDDVALVAGAGDQTSAVSNLTDGFGGSAGRVAESGKALRIPRLRGPP